MKAYLFAHILVARCSNSSVVISQCALIIPLTSHIPPPSCFFKCLRQNMAHNRLYGKCLRDNRINKLSQWSVGWAANWAFFYCDGLQECAKGSWNVESMGNTKHIEWQQLLVNMKPSVWWESCCASHGDSARGLEHLLHHMQWWVDHSWIPGAYQVALSLFTSAGQWGQKIRWKTL